MALLLLNVVFVTIGFRASNGRVSIIPVIVSASPTIIVAGSSIFVKLIRFKSFSILLSFDVVDVLCFGTGGAFDLGTSNSHDVIFSELFDNDVDKFVFDDKFTKLDAPDTHVCGLSIRFTELSATFGDVFRGGNGGADKF